MGLMQGYKQTGVGVIPEDWQASRLGDIGTVKTGPFGTLLKAVEYSIAEGTPLISVGEIGDGVFRVDENTPLVPPSVVKRLPEFVLRDGDIVLGRKGAVDRSVLVTERQAGWFLGSDGIRVRPAKSVWPAFVAFQFQSSVIRAWLLQNATGTTMATMNQEILNRISLATPPPQEQRAIAAALSDVDALLAKLDALIAKKRDIEQAAMQQLLTGRQRLPGFQEEWPAKRLSEIGPTYGGLTGKTKADFGLGSATYIPFLNILTNSVIDPNDLAVVQVDASESQNEVRKGDLFFNGSSETPEEVGMCSVLLDDLRGCYLNSFCFGFRPHGDVPVSGLYLAYFFRSGEGRALLYSLAQGATRYNLSKSQFLKIIIPLPAFGEQRAIAAVLSDMDAEISALEARREKTRALKQGMMQELLTGRIRLL